MSYSCYGPQMTQTIYIPHAWDNIHLALVRYVPLALMLQTEYKPRTRDITNTYNCIAGEIRQSRTEGYHQ